MQVSTLVVEVEFGGSGGIRTLGWVTPPAVFKTADLNHSPTLPGNYLKNFICNCIALHFIFLTWLNRRRINLFVWVGFYPAIR